MLKITIELWPHGRQVNKPITWSGTIINEGSGTETKGNYRAFFSNRNGRGAWRGSFLQGFPRKRDNVWKLLRDLLNNIDDGR